MEKKKGGGTYWESRAEFLGIQVAIETMLATKGPVFLPSRLRNGPNDEFDPSELVNHLLSDPR